jgi:transketolase
MTATSPQLDAALVRRLANTVRALSIDAIQKANSGHPGLPLGCADLAVTLWYHFLQYDRRDPHWPNRDRFVLSAGHGSMLLYSLLHLAGFDLPLDELKAFRQWGSRTPGHPEIHLTPGVEATTGPLGQGLSNSVGMALSAAMLRARFEDLSPALVDHYTYVLASDGDLMEGVASEACSLAGEWQLARLIVLYDDNDVTLDGPTDLSFSREDRAARFAAYGWHVQDKVDGFDPAAVAKAIEAAKADPRPSLICCKTIIGYGSPHKAGTAEAHGSPLGPDELKLTKQKLGIIPVDFHIPAEDSQAWNARGEALAKKRAAWDALVAELRARHPARMAEWDALHRQELPADIASRLPRFDPAKPVATRDAGRKAIEALAPAAPWLVGGSADLSGSTKAIIPDTSIIAAGEYKGRDLYFGVREHAMGAIANGITAQGAFRCYTATFLAFADYMRPAIRLAALSHIPSIFVFTHDSIFLGEDGPTHQPVEHAAALRAIPGLLTFRPGDAAETAEAWLAALSERKRPSAILLSRQNLPVPDRGTLGAASGTRRGAYVLKAESGAAPAAILIATGSEVGLALDAAKALEAEGIATRVVSMPCMELFREQDAAYRESVLPAACRARVAVEAGVRHCWHEWVGEHGGFVTMDSYGASAPAKVLAERFGFSATRVAEAARTAIASAKKG